MACSQESTNLIQSWNYFIWIKKKFKEQTGPRQWKALNASRRCLSFISQASGGLG